MNNHNAAVQQAMRNLGDRAKLLELAQEHTVLYNGLPPKWEARHLPDPHAVSRHIYWTRIEQIRLEQERILSRYVGG